MIARAARLATLLEELTVRPFIKILVCGGVARPQTHELVGPIASETPSRLTPDLCFLGPTGVDTLAGVTCDDEAEAAVNRVMVQHAKRSLAVADSAKLGAVRFSQICRLTEVAGVLTDDGADTAAVQSVTDSGVEVVVASAGVEPWKRR